MTDYEHLDDSSSDERGTVGLALTFLFVGLGLGALSALMFAPRTGKQMRKTLRRRYNDARDSLEDIGEQANDFLERGGDWARTAKKKVAPIAERMRR